MSSSPAYLAACASPQHSHRTAKSTTTEVRVCFLQATWHTLLFTQEIVFNLILPNFLLWVFDCVAIFFKLTAVPSPFSRQPPPPPHAPTRCANITRQSPRTSLFTTRKSRYYTAESFQVMLINLFAEQFNLPRKREPHPEGK